jgi:hypothetical protein
MNRLLIYTFRTFPWIEGLKEISENIIVLDKLTEDIYKVEKEINTGKYKIVLGLAKGSKTTVF